MHETLGTLVLLASVVIAMFIRRSALAKLEPDHKAAVKTAERRLWPYGVAYALILIAGMLVLAQAFPAIREYPIAQQAVFLSGVAIGYIWYIRWLRSFSLPEPFVRSQVINCALVLFGLATSFGLYWLAA
jgi:hypothetical protein